MRELGTENYYSLNSLHSVPSDEETEPNSGDTVPKEIHYRQLSQSEDKYTMSLTFCISLSWRQDMVVFKGIQVISKTCTLLKAEQMNYSFADNLIFQKIEGLIAIAEKKKSVK